MKKLVWFVLMLMLVFPVSSFAQDYDVYFVKSPDKKLSQMAIRGVKSDGGFSATIWDIPEGVDPINISAYDMKGLFGKVNLNTGAFQYLQIYDPPYAEWTMGFNGMSESGDVTSLTWEKYADYLDMPEESAVLKWDHMFNSIGWASYDDVHANKQVTAYCEGDPDWIGGIVADISSNGTSVGFELGGDAFAFNTDTGKFKTNIILRAGQGEFSGFVTLWGVNDNNWAVGEGNNSADPSERNFLLNTVTGQIIWTEDLDPEIEWEPGPIVGNVAINNNNQIAFFGTVTIGKDPVSGIVVFNFITLEKFVIPMSPYFDAYDAVHITDMSVDANDNVVIVGAVERDVPGDENEFSGWILYPAPTIGLGL